jgi:hypothetical protein
MIEKTNVLQKNIGNFSNNICIITNLYYDLSENQFIINFDIKEKFNINRDGLQLLGRQNPTYVGKEIILLDIPEKEINNIKEISFKNNIGLEYCLFIARRYSPHNFGHLLCETALPIEYVLNHTGITDKSKIMVIFDDDTWDGFDNKQKNTIYWFEGENSKRREQADTHSINLLKPLGDKVVFGFQKYISEYVNDNDIKERYLKIKNHVVTGMSSISPWNYRQPGWSDFSMSKTIDTYKKKIYENCISNSQINQAQNTITFLPKQGRRSVLNNDSICLTLKNFADKNNFVFEQLNPEEVSFNHQIEVLSRTKLLVTNGGATSFSSFLLKPDSIMLYFPILNNDFESKMFRRFPGRFKFIDYDNHDAKWKDNIKREDGSYDVDISILEKILVLQ